MEIIFWDLRENKLVFLTFLNSKNNINILSAPKPQPPCGREPHSNDFK